MSVTRINLLRISQKSKRSWLDWIATRDWWSSIELPFIKTFRAVDLIVAGGVTKAVNLNLYRKAKVRTKYRTISVLDGRDLLSERCLGQVLYFRGRLLGTAERIITTNPPLGTPWPSISLRAPICIRGTFTSGTGSLYCCGVVSGNCLSRSGSRSVPQLIFHTVWAGSSVFENCLTIRVSCSPFSIVGLFSGHVVKDHVILNHKVWCSRRYYLADSLIGVLSNQTPWLKDVVFALEVLWERHRNTFVALLKSAGTNLSASSRANASVARTWSVNEPLA